MAQAAEAAPAPADPALADSAGEVVRERFVRFLREYTSGEPDGSSQFVQVFKDFAEQVNWMKENDSSTLTVDFAALTTEDRHLAEVIGSEYYRFEPHLRMAVFQYIRDLAPDFAGTQDRTAREFFVSFHNIPSRQQVRGLKTNLIGHLVAFSGTVTRASEVRPELLYGVFKCNVCGMSSGKIEQQFKFTEPPFCSQRTCGNRTKWTLDVSNSQFVDWQRVRVQENPDEIPPGSMPRSVDVILRHAAVEKAQAGDKCTFTGTLVVIPDISQLFKAGVVPRSFQGGAGEKESEGFTGLKALGVRDLTYRTAFLANSVVSNTGPAGTLSSVGGPTSQVLEFTQSDKDAIADMSRDPDLYRKMVRSIAPTVYGHDEVKRGILLMLLGGVPKRTPDGSRLRGDINVCIVGDPATAKSQFLKYTCKFVPRAVYTSGKASSAAGLTASVAKDPETGEFAIEAGALMLADNGVCCIDEFDKMDVTDQVAIHEAMEQQTISITKAGIQATLNARASILAAANPILGRYDRSKPLRFNIALSPAIMSRFDLFFVVLDEMDEVIDLAIAKHIVGVHQQREGALVPDFEIGAMQKYVSYARSLNPQITPEAKKAIVSCYKTLRQNDTVGSSQIAYRITVRQLESMIRLSEALARLHLDLEIRPQYVHEAFRLLQQSIIHVDTKDIVFTRDDLGSEDKVTPEKYQRVCRMLALHLRQLEDEHAVPGAVVGLSEKDLTSWYISQLDVGTTDAAQELILLKHIINSLIDQDHVLYVLDGEEPLDEDSGRLLALNPDFNISA